MQKSEVFNEELLFIKDEIIRNDIRIILNLLPDYFYEVPASSGGKYHPKLAEGEGGLVRHTRAATRIANDMLTNPIIMKQYTSEERDIVISALIIHDGLKSGLVKEKYTRFDHPILMGNYLIENKDKLKMNKDVLDKIVSCIKSHMGPWNTNDYSNIVLPVPVTKIEKLVHLCDYLSSRKTMDFEF